MSITPLVSINIPIYKCEKYLLRCLESVKNQTYKNLEILLINDCTPDNSLEIIEQFRLQNPKLDIHLFHNETNQGLSVVRNKGIENSTGKYIYMLDSDDYITPDCIEKLVQIAEIENPDIVVGETICLDSTDNSEKMLFPIKSKKEKWEGNEIIFHRFIEGDWPIIAPNKLYNRNWILENNLRFVKGLYSQDELWAFHCAFKINKIVFLKEVTYIYFLHGESVIFNRTKRNFENYLTILGYFAKGFEETDKIKKKLILKKIIHFKNMVMVMQWKAMRKDVAYMKENYSRMKSLPKLSLKDYFQNYFSWKEKKLNLYQNLPTAFGITLFIWRFGN